MNNLLWDLSIPEIPPRSRLYALTPLGLGSPFVESLTSYLCRLAYEHHVEVGTLIRYSIAPSISKPYITGGQSRSISSFLRYATPINGNGVMASDWSEALATLTLRSDLSQLTLLVSVEALSHRDLLQPVKQWCPICYSEWRHQNTVIYEPLLWFMNGVTVCPKHYRVLEKCCPCCASNLPWLSYNSLAGYCSNCRKWLGNQKSEREPEKKDIYIAEIMSDFLSYISQLSLSLSPNAFTQSLQKLVSVTTEGNIAAFSRRLDVPKTTMWELVQGHFPPSLPFLFHLCWQFRISLLSLFTEIGDSAPEASDKKVAALSTELVKKRKSRRPFDYEKVKQALEEILADPQSASLSMRGVAQRLGYPTRTITTHFPEEARKISQRHLDYCKQRGLQRRGHLEQCIKEAVFVVNDQGELPTFRRVGAMLNGPGCFREFEARQAFFDAQKRTIYRENK